MAFRPKSDAFEQFARTSDDELNRSYTATEDTGSAILVDDNGRIIVREKPGSPSGAQSVLNHIEDVAGTNPATNQMLIYDVPIGESMMLDKMVVYQTGVQPLFLQIHLANIPLTGGEVPRAQFQLPGNRTLLQIDFPYETGTNTSFRLAVSTSELTWTAPVPSVDFSAFGSFWTET